MKRAIRTAKAAQPKGHYSQAVRAGNLLFISGQLPLDPSGEIVRGTVAQQTLRSLANVRCIVEAAGGSIGDIVQCTIYLNDSQDWAEVNSIYGDFFAKGPVLPARAVVPVKKLHYGARLEIQAVAILSGKR